MTNLQILDAINQNIKRNENKEITGVILNSVLRMLLDFVNQGFITFSDIIKLLADSKAVNVVGSISTTTDTTSLPSGVYHAQITGTYTNAGNIVVKEGYYTLLRKEGVVWKLESEVKMPTLSVEVKVEEGNTEAVSGGEVFKNTIDVYSIFKREYINVINPNEIETGYLNNGIFSSNPNYLTTGFINCNQGDVVRTNSGLNWAVYDEDFQLIEKSSIFNFSQFTVTNSNAAYFRVDTHNPTNNWMITINKILPSAFVPYGYNLIIDENSNSGGEIIKTIKEQVINNNIVKEELINIFDFSAPRTPGYVTESGNISNSSAASVSDFIKIDNNTNYSSTAQLWHVATYNENKEFIELLTASYGFNVTNSSAKYVRLNMVNGSTNETTIVAKSRIFPPYFVPYNKPQFVFKSNDPFQYSWLTSRNRGKTWLTLGDSICNGVPYGYRYQTTMLLDLVNVNHAKDGATIGYFPDGARVISDYIDTITDDADIITVHAMVNDCSGGLPIGTFSDTTNITFYGAYRMLAEKLLNKFTGKKIAFFTAVQRVGNTNLKPYVDVIKEVGAFYGIPVLDLNATCGLYPDLQSYRKYYDDIGLHPNLEGHKIITPKVVDFINSL